MLYWIKDILECVVVRDHPAPTVCTELDFVTHKRLLLRNDDQVIISKIICEPGGAKCNSGSALNVFLRFWTISTNLFGAPILMSSLQREAFMTKHLVVVAGNIGAGKTSLAERIGARLGGWTGYESVADNPYLADFYTH